MLARRFLGCVFVLILLAVAGAIAFYQFGSAMLVRAATPKGAFERPAAATDPDYAVHGSWLSRPGAVLPEAQWTPDGVSAAGGKRAATFYVHPTTYLATDRWNAPLRPAGQAETSLRLFLQSQASAFNGVSDIWAPRYRQAAYGAFLLDNDNARQALDLAYADVAERVRPFPRRAFPPALRSSLPVTARGRSTSRACWASDATLFAGGWSPLMSPAGRSEPQADLPAMGLGACRSALETGCLLSWQSFAEPANTKLVTDAWVGTRGLAGRSGRAPTCCASTR